MSGASNTLAREFLTDVHQLCSAVAQRAEAREEDEEESHMVALGEYLVRGRGFLLLSTLDSIIDQVSLLDAEEFSQFHIYAVTFIGAGFQFEGHDSINVIGCRKTFI